jgi:hypothetical protein
VQKSKTIVQVKWYGPFRVEFDKKRNLYNCPDLQKSEYGKEKGVYYFSRKFGNNVKIEYIGSTTVNFAKRMNQHFKNNVSLMMRLFKSPRGYQQINIGIIQGAGQGISLQSLAIKFEKRLISWALEEGYPIFNLKGRKVKEPKKIIYHCRPPKKCDPLPNIIEQIIK